MKRRNALSALGAAACIAAVRTSAAAALPGPGASAEAATAPPVWVPPPGRRRNVSRNFLADVDPCPARTCNYSGIVGQRAVLAAWCGAAFATAYGRLGAWITTGGGHGDYHGNEVYAFELDTLAWRRLNDPYPGGPDSAVDYAEGEYAPGTPLSTHTYQHVQYLLPVHGGGPQGSLLLVVSYAAGKLARGSGRAHACDLATGRWSRFSENKARVRLNATSATCFDDARRGYWRVPYSGAQIEFLDAATRQFRTMEPGSAAGNNFGVNHTCAYDPARDILVVLDWPAKSGAVLWLLDLASPTRWWRAPIAGEAPPPWAAQGMALEWCAPLRCFVGYDGGGSAHVWKLVPPDDGALERPWHWATEVLDGEAPAGRSKGPRMSFSRFRWAPAARCFLWADDHRLPVQAWRPVGT